MDRKQFKLNDIVELRKSHPCGSSRWKVVRMGMDIRVECQGCGRMVMLPRSKFERMVKKICPEEEG